MLKTGASANAPVFLCPKKGELVCQRVPSHVAPQRHGCELIKEKYTMRIEQELKLGFKDVLFV